MSDQTSSASGSVAEETARLLEALMGVQADPAGAAREAPEATAGEHTHTPGAAEDVCRLCPVCQLLRVARSVSPQTLDRLADLASAVTETLREVAAARWQDTGRKPEATQRPQTQDIPVRHDTDDTDDDEDEDAR